MADRPFDSFFRISRDTRYVLIAVDGKQYEATPSGAREIARNLVRMAAEVDEVPKPHRVVQRAHLRRVK